MQESCSRQDVAYLAAGLTDVKPIKMGCSVGVETEERHLVVNRYDDGVHVVAHVGRSIFDEGIPVNRAKWQWNGVGKGAKTGLLTERQHHAGVPC